ncbi:serine/threonine dehydratase [Gemmatimonadetes bacterium T265]|nr:serine/threonine dehydratase [Gemmatimonadetes bacterium T265]
MTTAAAPASPALPSLAALEAAAATVHRAMPPTPQYRWPLLEARTGVETWVKHENHTPVGAFKIRGGLVHLDRLARAVPRVLGVVTATRGNHGQSVGFAARRAGIPALVVVPRGNAREKNAAMRALGVELVEAGDDFQAAVEAADGLAAARGWYRLPSFHPDLVAGVGTYALELFRATAAAGAELDTVYVPIGLGSGACGVLAAKAALGARADVVGVVSAHAPAYARSLASGRAESHPATTVLADGMACRTPVPEALAALRGDAGGPGLARVVEVSDAEVAGAMRALFADTHNAAEGAGAAALAALLQERERAPELVRGRRVAVVLCGGNVDAEVFARVLAGS